MGTNFKTGNDALASLTTGTRNTAVGVDALGTLTDKKENTAVGFGALSDTNASFNVAVGNLALTANTTGTANTAVGAFALQLNLAGKENVALGNRALDNNTSGNFNVALGREALRNNASGSRNIAIGRRAGLNVGGAGSDNILIGNQGSASDSATIRVGNAGTHTRAFIHGIRGVTTGAANGIAVLVDSNGQLGTVSSSQRFKDDITDMAETSSALLDLRPVTFRYKERKARGEQGLEYGLIAEEVAEVLPDLVVYDEDGRPLTVRYHLLSSLLLNELQKQRQQLERQAARLAELETAAGLR